MAESTNMLKNLLKRKMESVDLEMNDIFGEDNVDDDDDDFPTVGPLPDLPTQEEPENEEDAENSEVLSKLKDLSKGAAKKVVRHPQPKLDATRLTGDRGIPILPKVFENVKFKGRGHEAEDLRIVMRYLEHWTHRLFPKMPFDEVLERIERLGTKREVQTCIKKMRLDMPLLNDEFVSNDNSDDEGNKSHDNSNGTDQDGIDVDTEEIWDEIMKEEYERQKSQSKIQPKSPTHITQQLLESSTPVHSQTPSPTSSISGGLTPEQLERIERNKRMALEKKAARNRFASPGFHSQQSLASQQMPPPQSPIMPRVRRTSPQNSSTVTSSLSSETANISSLDVVFSTGSPYKSFIQNSPLKSHSKISQNGESHLTKKSGDILSLDTNAASENSDIIPVISNHVNGVTNKSQNGEINTNQKGKTGQNGEMNTNQKGEMNISQNGEMNISQNGEMNISQNGEMDTNQNFGISQNGEMDINLQSSEMSEVTPLVNKTTVNIDNSEDMSEIIPLIQNTDKTVS